MILRYIQSPQQFTPTVLIISAIIMVLAFIVHNMVQAWVASRYGDNSARFAGFNKFDPQTHLDPFGIGFLFVLGFGWPKTIPVNSRNYRGRGKQEALVWYSGPLAYLAIAALCYLVDVIFASQLQYELSIAFQIAASYCITHAVINLFPVFPLDGAMGALALGNPQVRQFIQQVRQLGFLGFIIVFYLLGALGVTGAITVFFRALLRGIWLNIPGL